MRLGKVYQGCTKTYLTWKAAHWLSLKKTGRRIWVQILQMISGPTYFKEFILLQFVQDSLIQFRIVHRLHMSKVKLSKIYPEVDPICDRCRQAPATLFHTFWSCSGYLILGLNI